MNVYDFDNTIYDGESTFDFFVYCIGKHPSLVKFLPKVVLVVLRYKMCRISKDELLELMAEHQREFLKIAGDMDILVKGFWDRNICKIKNFYRSAHRSDDVVLSASFSFLLDEAASRLGITNLVCSRMDMDTGEVRELCFRDNKPKLFEKYFPNGIIENFYTDSLNDMPMIKLAKNAYIVKGERIKKYTD